MVNKSAWIQVMVWRRTGEKPLPESMMSQFNHAHVSPGLNELIKQKCDINWIQQAMVVYSQLIGHPVIYDSLYSANAHSLMN